MSPQLSFDIQVEIIKRLPVKSLIQFRSVCKAWKSSIDSSHFIAGYGGDDQPRQHLMIISYRVGEIEREEVRYVCFVDDDDTIPQQQQKFSLTVPPLVRGTTILGSSHGLLCSSGYFRGPGESSWTERVVLWNPAIRKSIAIVVPNEAPRYSPFDRFVGFGVCPHTKDPKLLSITYIRDRSKMESISCIPCQVMVFTLSSGEWRCLCSDHLPRKSIQFDDVCQIDIGWFIYWVANDITNSDGTFYNLIMSFDLSTDEFREVHLPDSLHKSDLTISRLRESLVLLDYNIINPTSDKRVCDVWMMMEHGDSKVFTKLYTINVPNASVSRALGFRKSGEPIVEMEDDCDDDDELDVDIGLTSTLAVYEPCLDHIKDLGICGNNFSFFLNSYTESLLLLDHEDGRIIRCGAVKI